MRVQRALDPAKTINLDINDACAQSKCAAACAASPASACLQWLAQECPAENAQCKANGTRLARAPPPSLA
jgi:hypothetical protein